MMATLLMRASTDGTSADKKRRARKGKNAQKKQPQRGLGVAQLEKLRLQEQSLLCPTSSYSLRLCTPAEHSMSRGDSDVAQTVLSLTNGTAAAAASSLREIGGPRLALSGHSSTHLQSLSTHGNNEAVDAKRAASRALARLNQSSKFSASNAPFFSSVLTTTPHEVYECQGPGHEEDERRHGPGETSNSPLYIYSAIHNLKEAAPVSDSAGYKLHPVFKDVSRIPITITDPHYVESLLSSDTPHVPRKRIELPVAGVSPNADKSKELHSFQNLPSNQAWSSPEKASGRKRPWLAVQDNGRQISHAQALDLNAPAGPGENDISHNDRHCMPVTQELVSDSRVGAHYTTGIIRSALGNSCLPLIKLKACSSVLPWQGSESPSSATGYSDMALYTENSLLFKQCASPSVARDSCSSATGSTSYLTLNRKGCLNDPGTPSPVGKESICSSNFLTLGMSSSFNPGDAWHEHEESTQDTMMSINVDVKKLKQGSSSCCEGDEGSHIRSPIKQELGAVDVEKHNGLRNTSTLQSENVLSPASPISSNFGRSRPRKSAGAGDEDILDLRLKLAL